MQHTALKRYMFVPPLARFDRFGGMHVHLGIAGEEPSLPNIGKV